MNTGTPEQEALRDYELGDASTLSPLWMAAIAFVLWLLLTACAPAANAGPEVTQPLPFGTPQVVVTIEAGLAAY